MISTASRIPLVACVVCSVLLAISFFLPLSEHSTYLRADGRPAGILGQLFPDPNAAATVTYEYFWNDLYWMVPVTFFLPGVLTALMVLVPRLGRWISAIAPLVTGFLLVGLIAMVMMADFGINHERAYGGWVALGALGGFVLASTLLAWRIWGGRVAYGLRKTIATIAAGEHSG